MGTRGLNRVHEVTVHEVTVYREYEGLTGYTRA